MSRPKVWYRKWWGMLLALCIWPFFLAWLIWKKTGERGLPKLARAGVIVLAGIVFIMMLNAILPQTPVTTDTAQKNPVSLPKKVQTSSKKTSNTPKKVQTSNKVAPKASAAPATSPTPTLTGFGALQKDWNAHHTADNRYASESSFNPNPSLSEDGSSSFDDQYYSVNWLGGRALNYQMRLPHQQSTAVSKAEIMQEFPSDATVLWEQAENSDPTNACYALEVNSATLAKVLSSTGDVTVELYTEPTPDSSYNSYYNPSNVNSALIDGISDDKTPADFSGC